MRSSSTTFGLDERLERTLLYPLLAFAALSWPFGWLVGLIVFVVVFFIGFFVEKNRTVRWHALQAGVVFGVLFILKDILAFIGFILSKIPLLGFPIGLAFGFVGWIFFWVIIALAIWLTVMVFFRPNYRLPFVGKLIQGSFSKWL